MTIKRMNLLDMKQITFNSRQTPIFHPISLCLELLWDEIPESMGLNCLTFNSSVTGLVAERWW
jgi:hypothetical protein